MTSLRRRTAHGAAAGAAGTTALNAVTYLDMAIRARPASDTPQQAVATLATKTGHPVPGHDEEKDNRLGGLGPLTGTITGVGIGVLAGLCAPGLRRLPGPVAAALIGLAAMAATDGPLALLHVTDPRKWSATDWVSDLIPHLAYGVVTYATLRATTARAPKRWSPTV